MNKYIYFSSKGSYSQNDTSNSDFSVNFSNPIVIPPYAEIRCVNCRVNPDNNSFNVVEGENDRLAFAVGKFWINEVGDVLDEETYSNGLPLFSIKLDEGNYDLTQGTDPQYHLNAQIESKINEQITNIPNLRNGVSVEIDSKILTIKVSPMGANGYYSIPDGVNLPDDLVEKLKRLNSRTTSMVGEYFGNRDEYKNKRVECAPFNILAEAPETNMIPPNQVGSYDVTCGTLVGTFQVDDIVNINGKTLYAKILAVNANLPTKIEIWSPSDDWETDSNAPNISIEKGNNSCVITAYTSDGPDWRGVTLFSKKNDNALVLNRCGYYMSPPINWNSLGPFDGDSTQYRLASIFTIDLNNYQDDTNKITTFRGVYSCFTDAIKGMDTSFNTAGVGSGPFSGAIAPYSYLDDNGDEMGYDEPQNDDGLVDKIMEVSDEDAPQLQNYIFRGQLDITDDIGYFTLYLKGKRDQATWDWGDIKNTITGETPRGISVEPGDNGGAICIETYVADMEDLNGNGIQIVVKTRDTPNDPWETQISVKSVFPNYLGFHRNCHKGALDSKVNKPANIRFSYAHNAPNDPLFDDGGENYKDPGYIYWAGAYNPIDEANGFVDGQFRAADYITSRNTNLESSKPVLLFGVDSLDDTDRSVIANDNPNNNVVVDFGGIGEQRLLDSGANAGTVMGLDEQGWQYVKTNSQTTGIDFEGAVNTNARDFPQHYLDLPDLAINNYTGNVNGTGRPNKFICPVDLNSGGGQNNIHTSQNETLLYNDMGNAIEQRITNLRIRICDLEGTPSKNLQNYTFGCLEIRENPMMKRAKMERALRNDMGALEYQAGVQPNQRNRVQ